MLRGISWSQSSIIRTSSNNLYPQFLHVSFSLAISIRKIPFSSPSGELWHEFKTLFSHILYLQQLQSLSQSLNYQIGSESSSCLLNNLFIAAFFFSWALVRSWPFQPEHSSVIIPRAKGKITKVTKSKVIWAGDGDREWGNFCTLTLSRIERWSFIFKNLVLIHRVNKTLIPLFFYLNRINKSSKSTLLALTTQASIVLARGRFTLFILRLVAPHSQEIPLTVNMNSILASSF